MYIVGLRGSVLDKSVPLQLLFCNKKQKQKKLSLLSASAEMQIVKIPSFLNLNINPSLAWKVTGGLHPFQER